MEMIPVTSTDLSQIGYDHETATLRVYFLKGGIYDYQGVPQDIYEGLLAAGSKGQYFNTFIKKGGYPFTKLG
jgi:KTSC domain